MKSLNNKNFTIISRDCIGGELYHQNGLKFLSPTINLFFTPEDFNYFCLNLKSYIYGKLVELKDSNINYPLGQLIPRKNSHNKKIIAVHFMHYESFGIAKRKWNERKQRINFDNLFVINSFCYPREVATFSKTLLEEWNKIKYKKVVLVDQKYGFDNEFIIKKPEECAEYAWLLSPINGSKSNMKVFNNYDFIEFFNSYDII